MDTTYYNKGLGLGSATFFISENGWSLESEIGSWLPEPLRQSVADSWATQMGAKELNIPRVPSPQAAQLLADSFANLQLTAKSAINVMKSANMAELTWRNMEKMLTSCIVSFFGQRKLQKQEPSLPSRIFAIFGALLPRSKTHRLCGLARDPRGIPAPKTHESWANSLQMAPLLGQSAAFSLPGLPLVSLMTPLSLAATSTCSFSCSKARNGVTVSKTCVFHPCVLASAPWNTMKHLKVQYKPKPKPLEGSDCSF